MYAKTPCPFSWADWTRLMMAAVRDPARRLLGNSQWFRQWQLAESGSLRVIVDRNVAVVELVQLPMMPVTLENLLRTCSALP